VPVEARTLNPRRVAARPARGGWRGGSREIPNALYFYDARLEDESGVGKELVARQIHDLSSRRNGPFVAVNCAALVETLLEAELFGIEDRTATGVRGRRGKFEHADGGTLFLDEVSDLSLPAQAKLLRAIQDLSVERVGGTGAHRVNSYHTLQAYLRYPVGNPTDPHGALPPGRLDLAEAPEVADLTRVPTAEA
jgi:Sigma-54 interaction domain